MSLDPVAVGARGEAGLGGDGLGGGKLVLAFAGQGHQWAGMGRDLLRAEAVFRAAVERCDAAIAPHTGWSVVDRLTRDDAWPSMRRTDVLQPTLFTVQVALAALWRSWGVAPDAVVGQSMGEVAAAHIAGALTLEDAATVQCRRSALLQRISGRGTMAVVELPAAEAAALIADTGGKAVVAGYGSPTTTVLAGDHDSLDAVLARLAATDVHARRIPDTAPSHSPYVDELRDDLRTALSGVRPRRAAVPMYSTVTLRRIEGPELTAAYWFDNLREPVRLAPAVRQLSCAGHGVFLEISAHPVLTEPVRQCLEHAGHGGLALPSMRRNAELDAMRASRAALRALGRASAARARRVELTPYQAAVLPALFAACGGERPAGASSIAGRA
ncbi:acyltransferase domain-containing protein [Streptomyces syringium]|uniref:acyltransferase domain-containing protein n=1 Tax=Streptomyces syringium TaxID=76729 RepID=UPI00341139AA